MPKGRFEGLFPEEIENRKDYVWKLIESGLWTQTWALQLAMDHMSEQQIDEMLTFENVPLDIEFYEEPTNEKHLVARHPNVKEGYERGKSGN